MIQIASIDPQPITKEQHHCTSDHESSIPGFVTEAIKRSREVVGDAGRMTCLTTETIQCAALALQGVDNIEGGDGLALGVFCVGDGVTDDTLEEGFQDTACLFVDHWNDASDLRSRHSHDQREGMHTG